MNILILGATGMLGHKLCQRFSGLFNVWSTMRKEPNSELSSFLKVPLNRIIPDVDVSKWASVERAFQIAKPNVVINGIGIIKQSTEAKDPYTSILINSLFPHQLARLCVQSRSRLIHISTDCVFSGSKGNYKEDDFSDAEDLYGRSKYLGEVRSPGALTLRTSIIGPEIASTFGLLEWFLAQNGKTVKGYKKAIFSGFTTVELSEIISKVIQYHPSLSGLYQVSSAPIDKYALLRLIRDRFHCAIAIDADDQVAIDRSLDSTSFRGITGYVPPPWEAMIDAMALDAGRFQREAHI